MTKEQENTINQLIIEIRNLNDKILKLQIKSYVNNLELKELRENFEDYYDLTEHKKRYFAIYEDIAKDTIENNQKGDKK